MEVFCRIFFPQPLFRLRFSPTLVWEQEPGAVFVYRKQEFRVPVTYSSAGLRDREHRVPKDRGCRIVAIGDSFTEALQVPLEETYPAQLETLLNTKSVDSTCEVINFGTTGYGPDQYLIRLRDQAMAYQPDLVLVGVSINDLDDLAELGLSRLQGGALVFRRLDPRSLAGLWMRVRLYARGHSHLFTFLTYLEVRARRFSDPGAGEAPELLRRYHRSYPERRKAEVDLAEALFAEIRRVAEPRAGIAAVLFPAQEQVYPGRFRAICRDPGCEGGEWDPELPRILLGRVLARAGIPVIDLLPPLRSVAAAGAELYFRIDGHLNPAGNRVVAEFLAKELRVRGLPPRDGPPAAGAPRPWGPADTPRCGVEWRRGARPRAFSSGTPVSASISYRSSMWP